MDLPKIYLNEPVIVPAVDEKVFDRQWLSSIRIVSEPGKARVSAELIPYNGTDILSEPVERIIIENVFAEMQNEQKPETLRTLYLQMTQLLLQTIKAEKEYRDSIINY